MTGPTNDDILAACVALVDQCGATGFKIGYLHEGVPPQDAGWYAQAQWRGMRVIVDNCRSATDAAHQMSERLLTGATCRCRQPVTLTDDQAGCRWRLVGDRWEPGCDAPPLVVHGRRGDPAGINAALRQPMNRAQRRAAQQAARQARRRHQ